MTGKYDSIDIDVDENIPMEANVQWMDFYKEQLKVREEWYKNLDKEQWAMWIDTRNMRQFLEGFTESLDQIHNSIEELHIRLDDIGAAPRPKSTENTRRKYKYD